MTTRAEKGCAFATAVIVLVEAYLIYTLIA